ncbi:MAG TPA: FUSC family protein [Mycobacteriales bacterium]|nr:FUSC family protein [Mycobacteriales bacterium]
MRGLIGWIRGRHPGRPALARALRAAVVIPIAFAVAQLLTNNTQMPTFAAFGSFALLLFLDPPGPARARLLTYGLVAGIGTVSISIATACSMSVWTAVPAMAVVGFVVLMAASLGSYAAGATTAMLLTFVLPVSIPVTWSELPWRLAGWGVAAAFSVPAGMLLRPRPAPSPLRAGAAASCRALGALLVAEAGSDPVAQPAAAAAAAAAALRREFAGTPYRPGGAGDTDRALAVLVDQLDWMAGVAAEVAASDRDGHPCRGEIDTVVGVAGALLDRCATGLLTADSDDPIRNGLRALRAARSRAATATLDRIGAADGEFPVTSARDPSFAARALGFAAQTVAEHVLQVRGAGWRTASLRRWTSAAGELTRQQLDRRSSILRAAVRGAAGLALAVLLATELGVQHAFWVVLGSLSVLRSSALGTGATAVRAVLGTAFGVAIGGAVLVGVGTNHTVLWILLPITILVAGIAPTAISFAAGQAAFTVVVVVLFTIIAPKGQALGLIRIEDVALGCGVSVVVGALFWPRGAAIAFGSALDDAYGAASDRVRSIVHTLTGRPTPNEKNRALAARQRLDDAFRQFLAEPGAKRVPMEDVAALAGAATRLRLVADSLDELCASDSRGPLPGELAEAGAELRAVVDGVDLWYRTLGDLLAGRRSTVPSADPPDSQLPGHIIGHLRTGVGAGDAAAGRQALLLLWSAQHLDSLRRAEPDLVDSAGVVAGLRRRSRTAP